MISWSKKKKAGWRVEYNSSPYGKEIVYIRVYNPEGKLILEENECRLTPWGRWIYVHRSIRRAMVPEKNSLGVTKVLQY